MATNREELKSRQGAMLLLDDKKGKPLSSVGSRAPSQQTVTFSPGFNTVTPMASGVRWDGEQPGAAAAAIAASGGARGAAAMTESRPRGLETRERRVDCRTRGFPCAYAYGLCYTVQGLQGLHLQFDMGTIQEERLRRGPPPHFLGEETGRSRWTS